MYSDVVNNILTSSRMSALLSCPRKHYWRYEVGLMPDSETNALRFGRAWALAMQARAGGADYETALQVLTQVQCDELQVATFSGLLAGYYHHYSPESLIKKLHSEVAFSSKLDGSRTFDVAGKMDGLAELTDGRAALKEDKTTSDSIAPDSDFWLRLRWNAQLYQYILAARALGWDVQVVIYDVTRKPAIRPKQVPKQDRIETPEEYGQRLAEDTIVRPDFYFARREVPIIEQDIEEFRVQRLALSWLILQYRKSQNRVARPEQAWPRNVSELTCRKCPFSSFCLQNISIDLQCPPSGFKISDPNPELS